MEEKDNQNTAEGVDVHYHQDERRSPSSYSSRKENYTCSDREYGWLDEEMSCRYHEITEGERGHEIAKNNNSWANQELPIISNLGRLSLENKADEKDVESNTKDCVNLRHIVEEPI